MSNPKETPFPQIPKGERDKWLSVVPISMPQHILVSRLPKYRKYLLYISGSRLASLLFSPPLPLTLPARGLLLLQLHILLITVLVYLSSLLSASLLPISLSSLSVLWLLCSAPLLAMFSQMPQAVLSHTYHKSFSLNQTSAWLWPSVYTHNRSITLSNP